MIKPLVLTALLLTIWGFVHAIDASMRGGGLKLAGWVFVMLAGMVLTLKGMRI